MHGTLSARNAVTRAQSSFIKTAMRGISFVKRAINKIRIESSRLLHQSLLSVSFLSKHLALDTQRLHEAIQDAPGNENTAHRHQNQTEGGLQRGKEGTR